MNNAVAGFSKLSKKEKINWIANEYFSNPEEAQNIIRNYWNSDEKLQQLHDEFIENIGEYALNNNIEKNIYDDTICISYEESPNMI